MPPKPRKSKAQFWKRQARIWHWISGAVCLTGMLLFAATGITLNHAGQIEANPQTRSLTFELPETARSGLASLAEDGTAEHLPRDLAVLIRRELGVWPNRGTLEWSPVDVYVSLPRPGGDAWMSIDFDSGEVLYEETSRGAIALLNDLHKGRHTGTVWAWFLDIFSVATILFCLTGLWLLQIHAGKRAITWPLVAGGTALPVLLVILFVHM